MKWDGGVNSWLTSQCMICSGVLNVAKRTLCTYVDSGCSFVLTELANDDKCTYVLQVMKKILVLNAASVKLSGKCCSCTYSNCK